MSDRSLINEVAKLWVELGGDSEGVAWSWRLLKERVAQIEASQQGFAPDAASLSAPDDTTGAFDDSVIGSLP